MLKALIIKELREAAGIVVLALVACVAARVYATSNVLRSGPSFLGSEGFPFISDSFANFLALIVGAMAIALGIKQSAWEAGQNTYLFLLHRPAGRPILFGTKLLVGGGLVFAVGGLAIIAYALWAAAPGNSPTPFFWSMTGYAWKVTACVLVVYLGSFLSGLRPARWFGTRLAPLMAACGLALLASALSWWAATIAILIAAALNLAGIFYYSQARDY